MICCLSFDLHQQVDLKYILDASTLVLSLCVAAVPITRGVAVILPKSLHGVCRQLASPFENFLTLEDLAEIPGNIVDVSRSKTRILVASACLVSISSLVSLLLQLLSGDPQSTLHATVLFVTWVSLTCCYFLNLESLTTIEVLYFFQGRNQTV